MKIVKRTMHFPIFNPKVNDFYYERHDYSRPATQKEKGLCIRYRLLVALFAITIISYALGLIFALAIEINLWDLTLIPITVVWVWLLVTMLNQLFKWEEQICDFQNHGFETEELQYDQVAQEQNDIAEKWRAEHPLEEAIRKAQKTKNCNDIAALLKLYQSGDLKQ